MSHATEGAPALSKVHRVLSVNGENHEVAFDPRKTLLEVLREDMLLTGTKHGCELGECGACTVLIDGEPKLSCLVLGLESDGVDIRTIEGLAQPDVPHALQTAYGELGASQCGYCSPGFLMNASALLARDTNPSREAIVEELGGNICRCTGYLKILEAVELAAQRLRDGTAANGGSDV